MKITILDGSPASDEVTSSIGSTLVQSFQVAGHSVVRYRLSDMRIDLCVGCFSCWTRTPGMCIQKYGGHDVSASAIDTNWMVFFTPVVFGGYSSTLKRAVDHLIPNISPFFQQIHGETHHQQRYASYPDFMAIGVLPVAQPGAEAIFRGLAERNARNLYPKKQVTGFVYSCQDAAEQAQAIGALVAQVSRSTPINLTAHGY